MAPTCGRPSLMLGVVSSSRPRNDDHEEGSVAASSAHLDHQQSPHKMGEITVLYFAGATTATKRTSETFTLPDDGLKLSDLAKLIVSRYPNSGIDRVLDGCRWSVDADLIYDLDSFLLKGGEVVAAIPHVSGG